ASLEPRAGACPARGRRVASRSRVNPSPVDGSNVQEAISMARRRSSSTSTSAEVDLTPMLDVVFIMLIFFIVTASFVKEAGVDVTRPPAATAESKDKGNILIAITESGRIWIDRRQVDASPLQAHIERLHGENPQRS